MIPIDPNGRAELVASIHAPWRASVAECLARWASLNIVDRERAFLVVEGDEPGTRHTLNARRIAELVARNRLPPTRLAA